MIVPYFLYIKFIMTDFACCYKNQWFYTERKFT